MAKALPPKLQQTIESQVQQAAKEHQLQLQKQAADEAAHPNTLPVGGVVTGRSGESASKTGSLQTEDKSLSSVLDGRIELIRHADGQHILAIHLSLIEWLGLVGVLLVAVMAWWGWCYRRK